MNIKMISLSIFALVLFSSTNALAQGPNSAALIAAQKEAIKPLSYLYGVWRGTGVSIAPNGEKHEVIQTERIGPFLDGSVIVLEGRGYDGQTKQVAFNAFGIISYNPSSKKYTLHSQAQGQVGDFAIRPITDGYEWEIPAGPATIKYTCIVKNGVWHEVGDMIAPGKAPSRFFEMTLKRVSDTDWPAAGAIPIK